MSSFLNSKEFLVRFNSRKDLLRFRYIFRPDEDQTFKDFEFDDCFYLIVLTEKLLEVRTCLHKFFHVHDYAICYPVAILPDPLLL